MSLAVLADHMASKGRGPDSMLIHMSPREVQGLQALAMKHGGSLTINPDTGLPEAGFLDKLLPAIIGFAVTATTGIPAWQVGLGIGAEEAVRTGDLTKGITRGLQAYSGGTLGGNLADAGASTIGAQTVADAAAANQATVAGTFDAGQGILPADAEALQKAVAEKMANASPYEKLAAGIDSAKANPFGTLKSNALPLAGAVAPAILAELGVKQNMPQTVTRPGMIAPSTYDPYSGTFVRANPYEATYKRAAEGGIMGFDESANSPMSSHNLDSMGNTDGMFNYAHDGGGVMRMAEGGIAGYAPGGYVPSDTDIFNYFKTPGLTDAKIAQDMQTFGVSAADIARATGTQGQQADYEKRFVNTLVAPTTDASEFMAATKAVGLQDQSLANAMKNAGLSQGAQYALTHADSDAGFTKGIIDASTGKPISLYTDIGYTAGALPGDKGGLEGLYGNINYVSSGLQNLINSGKMTVADAQNAALAELARTGVSVADVNAATGKDFGSLFTPKTISTIVGGGGNDTITGGGGNDTIVGGGGNDKITKTQTKVCETGYHLSADGLTCVKDAPVIIDWKDCGTGYHWDKAQQACVKNTDATQHTTDTVDTSTSLITAPATTLPVGVSGTTGPSIEGGGATVNANGTITTSPVIPGIPVGGFTGMESLRNAYTKGGGSLGYIPTAPKTIDEFNAKYNKLTGGSKQAYDYLMGKTPYSPTPYTPTGQVMKPYAESVLGIPSNPSKKMYIFDPATKQYKINPDYAIPTYDSKGNKTYNVTNKDVSTYLAGKPSNTDFYNWAKTNNLSMEQIAAATGMPITEVQKMFSSGAPADTTATTGGGSGGSTEDTSYKVAADGGLMAEGGLAALTMARGGMAQGGDFNLGSYSDGGRLLKGPGDGVSDSIPAVIGNKQPARLADGEFVVPARIVSELGNGSTEAGARKLYAMMDRVQAARKGSIGKGKVAKNSRADKYLPA